MSTPETKEHSTTFTTEKYLKNTSLFSITLKVIFGMITIFHIYTERKHHKNILRLHPPKQQIIHQLHPRKQPLYSPQRQPHKLRISLQLLLHKPLPSKKNKFEI